ncbi:hypothetical protein PMAYCL1PPCAC_07286 [Pristionchus mayeri]|uniref:Uncharacterized protein n=1 Tax=Pristionchus mayeri TaxID=1317129 RepID=A0AAN4ZDG6_9BILA|nr:hypothetical protein PMAYCL1PPCAC_07286 [Pristionchus mayeri]
MEKLRIIHDSCRYRDINNQGHLTSQQILQCFAQIIPSATFHSSPWTLLLRQTSPFSSSNQSIDYDQFFKLLAREKFGGGFDDSKKSLADMLMSAKSSLNGHLSTTFTSEKSIREKGRVQIVQDIESLLSRFPQIDLSRLKVATAKKKIAMDELKTIFDLHGIESHFRPLFPRLFMSFKTDGGLFHYSSFVDALSRVKVPERASAPVKNKKILPWQMPPLPPAGTKFEERREEEEGTRHISA